MTQTTPKRLLWIVNHQALMRAEVPILCALGWEVFIPKLVPPPAKYRSGAVSYEFDAGLTLPGTELAVLNLQDFYQRPWSPTVEAIVNDSFDVLVTSVSRFTLPLSEAVWKFEGTVVARVFGLQHPRRYSEWPPTHRPDFMAELEAIGDRFLFAQAFPNLAEIEDEPLRGRARTVTQALSPDVYRHEHTWRGSRTDALFLCPAINDGNYYASIYRGLKESFGDLPHRIFGRQFGAICDPVVLPYMNDHELIELFAEAPVFVYPSCEPRHVHLAVLEAMIVGTPVVYRCGALLDHIAGERLPGACADDAEMRATTARLLAGDRELAARISASQGRILAAFADDLARRQWQDLLTGSGP
jgi:hypothetical protein